MRRASPRGATFLELRRDEVLRISLPRTSVNSTVRIHRGFITGRYRRGSSAATIQIAFPNGRRVSSWGVKHRQARYKLGLSYIFVAISTRLLLKSFTFMSMCGMNQDLTSVRILLSLSHYHPDTGTGSEDSNRTLVEPLAQPLSKQTSQPLTPLHILSPAHPLLRASM